MTDYSFRTEIILPESDLEIPQEVVDAVRRKIDRMISEALYFPGPPSAPKLFCGCCGVLHQPGCAMWCYT